MSPASNPASNPGDRSSYLRIGRAGNTCLLCNAPLNVDGKHPSTLEVKDAQEAIRKDFCPACWPRLADGGYFSFWVTKRVSAPSAKERRLARSERNEALWRLFAALYSSDEASNLAPQLFFLAHLLMRYKVLTFQGPAEDGLLEFQHPRLGETFRIADVPVEEVDFSAVQRQVEDQALAYAPEESPSQPPAGE